MRLLVSLLTTFLLTLSTSTFSADNIEVVGIFGKKAIIKIDGKQQVLKPGQTAKGVTVEKIEKSAVHLTINNQTRIFPLGSPIRTRYAERTHEQVTIGRDTGGMFTTSVIINGLSLPGMIDTGATTMALSSRHADAINLNFRTAPKKWVETASGVIPAYAVTLKTVRVGSIEVSNVSATVVDGNLPSKVLIGNSFLHSLTMEHQSNMLLLKQAK